MTFKGLVCTDVLKNFENNSKFKNILFYLSLVKPGDFNTFECDEVCCTVDGLPYLYETGARGGEGAA